MGPATPSSRRLVLVTGPGRSGTSSVTGALEILGLVIPEPVKPADERNERGYFEPQWVVDFHETYVNALPVRTLDSRPYAAEVALEHAREADVAEELRTWLASKVGPERMLVKDPRLLWVHPLWLEVADGLGLDTVMLAMLRHPAEVVGSRDSAYLTAKEQRFRDQRAVAHVAGWTNVVLETERASRGRRRSFVRYDDLLQDWRTTLARTDAQLDLGLGVADLGAGHHPVDDFIDPALHKSRLTWDDVDVPPVLRDLAEETWQAADQLVERPDDEALHATFDGLRARYAALHQLAEAVAMDVTTAAVTTERAARQRRIGKLKQRVARLEQQLEQRPEGEGAPRLGDAVQAVRRRLGRGRS